MTGPNARTGEDMWNSAQIAAEEINDAGGVLGRRFVLVRADTESDITKGTSAVRRAIVEKGAEAVLGCYHSSIGINIIEIAHQYHVPYIVASCVADSISEHAYEKGYEEIFHYSPTGKAQGWSALTYMKNYWPDSKTVGFVMESTESAIMYKAGVQETAEKDWPGLEYKEWMFEFMTTDLYTELTELKAFKPDLLISQATGVSVPALIKQSRELGITGIKVAVHSGTLLVSDEMLKLAPDEIETWAGLSQVSYGAPMSPKTFPFIDKFEARHGHVPLYSGVAEYDVIHVYAAAVEAAGTSDTDAVIKALEEIKMVGAKGTIMFEEVMGVPHRCPIPWVILQWQGKPPEMKLVFPLDIAQTEPVPFNPAG